MINKKEQIIRLAVKINKENKVEGVWESTDMTHMEKGALLLELEGILSKLKDDWLDSDFIERDYNREEQVDDGN